MFYGQRGIDCEIESGDNGRGVRNGIDVVGEDESFEKELRLIGRGFQRRRE